MHYFRVNEWAQPHLPVPENRNSPAHVQFGVPERGIEALQYIFSLGASDVTDIITNTSGGIIGWILFKAIEKLFNNNVRAQKFINIIAATGTVLIILFITAEIKHAANKVSIITCSAHFISYNTYLPILFKILPAAIRPEAAPPFMYPW